MTSDDAPPRLRAALALARQQIPVFPCAPSEKRPLTRHGLHDATTDPDLIRRWWRRHPDANLAMPTGTASFDVLDVDVRANGSGFPALRELKQAGLLAGRLFVVRTPSFGWHVYFQGTDQSSGSLPNQHLDFKATGGYVLVPPSTIGGHDYELTIRYTGERQPFDWAAARTHLAPTRRTTAVAEFRRPNRSIRALAAWVARLPEGQRNRGTFWAACRASEQGIVDLGPLLEAAISAGLPHAEAVRTIDSAVRQQTIHSRGDQPVVHRSRPSGAGPRRAAGA